MIRSRTRWSIFLILAFLAPGIHAETAYVTDLLRLNMYEKPNSGGKLIMSAGSGTALKILERQPGFARVKAPDGSTGWVKSAYLVKDKPARLIVDIMRANLEKALRDRNKMKQKLEGHQGETSRLESRAQQAEIQLKTAKKTMEELKTRNAALQKLIDNYGSSVPLSLYAGSVLICLLLGLALGWFWLDYKIRKRHGGFRIY